MKEPYGVLMFPSFAENTACLSALKMHMEEQGLPTRVPALRGHGATSPDALRGVTWHDWMADAESALTSILADCDKAILIGHSMGALVALNLAADHGAVVDSIVLAAPAIHLASPWAPGHPLNVMLPVLAHLVTRQPTPSVFADPALAHDGLLYPWASCQ